MAQADGVVANGTGSAVRADINGQLAALFTNHSGSTQPSTTFAFQTWADTNTNTLKLRNSSNDGWVQLARLDGQFDAKTFNGNVTLNAQSDLRLADSDSSNWVAFQAPATVSSNVTWTLPSTDGSSGQALTTNGSGTLSWTSPAASTDIISEGNTSAEVVDTGSDGHFKVTTEGTEALRIDSSQRVGIGTAAPAKALHVSTGNNADSGNIAIALGGTFSGLRDATITKNTSSPYNLTFTSSNSGATHAPLIFETLAGSEKARLDTSGRLLVGTSTASGANLLQVSGDAKIHGLTVGRGNNTNEVNTAVGINALANSSAVNNTAFGYYALSSNTSGSRNTALGMYALRDCTTSTNNVAVGQDTLYRMTTGSGRNVAVGDQSGQTVTTGSYNTFVGTQSGQALNTGTGNTCLGYGAGYSITTGTDNVCIGNLAGDYINSLTTGVYNILIGYRPTPSTGSGTDQIVLGTRANTAQGKGNGTGFISPNGGGVYQGNNSSSWSTTSDRRLKKNIVDNTEGLDVINQVRVVNFEYRLPEEIEQEDLRSQALVKRDENDEITGLQGVKLGVIAQELQQICSDCVKEESSGVLGVVDDNLFWHMVNAVKELSAQNAALEARLTALENA